MISCTDIRTHLTGYGHHAVITLGSEVAEASKKQSFMLVLIAKQVGLIQCIWFLVAAHPVNKGVPGCLRKRGVCWFS